ncbi:MAG: hypothetical protein EXR78_02250 [Deltaproteobacteria bacterium]|nr:hypothetical protein [Deltaproteobacteria bacterium]
MSDPYFTKTMEDLFTAYKTFTVDLPLAGTRWAFGIGQEKDVTTTVWKGYDASIRVATAAVDSLYRTPLFGTTVSSVANQMLRWQQLGTSATNLMTTNLRQGIGIPTAAEVKALTERVTILEAKSTEATPKTAPRVTLNRIRPFDSHASTPTSAVEERAAA